MVTTTLSPSFAYKRKMLRDRKLREDCGYYKKFTAVNVETGKRTSAITLSRGRIAVGEDVWRMSNKYDRPEYPFRIMSQIEFSIDYRELESNGTNTVPCLEEVV